MIHIFKSHQDFNSSKLDLHDSYLIAYRIEDQESCVILKNRFDTTIGAVSEYEFADILRKTVSFSFYQPDHTPALEANICDIVKSYFSLDQSYLVSLSDNIFVDFNGTELDTAKILMIIEEEFEVEMANRDYNTISDYVEEAAFSISTRTNAPH